MKILEKKITELTPYPNNPRNNAAAVDSVAESIKRFGFKVPCVIDGAGTIITGHTRVLAAQRLGMETVPCVLADDLTPEQAREFRIADNRVGELATWDKSKLAEELQNIKLENPDNFTGFSRNEEIDLCGEPDLDDDGFDVDGAEAAVDVPRSKPRTLWLLGQHRLLCGDATDANDVKRLMDGKRATLLLTDPPYNVDYEAKDASLCSYRPNRRVDQHGNTKITNDKMADEVFCSFLYDAFRQAFEVMEPGAGAYVFHADLEGINFRQAFTDAGFKLAEVLIWVKNNLVLGRNDYQWRHEPVLYGWKEGATHHWYGHRDKTTVEDDGQPNIESMSKAELKAALREALKKPDNTIIYADKPQISGLHPTMKPLKLVGRFMANSSRPDDIVLDPFGGSGTTLIAAEKLGRTCYMLEIDPVYTDVIVHRWEQLTGGTAECKGVV